MSIIGTLAILPMIDNPLDGILPDFGIFGVEFTQLWQKLLGGLWGLAIIAAIAFLLIGVTQMAAASTSGNPSAYKDSRNQAMWGGISLGILAALAVIVGAILALFG
jgi:Type IV secretion system pilin